MKKALVGMLTALLLLTAGGCMFLRGPGDVRHDVQRMTGLDLDRRFGIQTGRVSMWIARRAMKWSGEDEVSLKGVRGVEVGVYEVDGPRRGYRLASDEQRPSLCGAGFSGWEPVVRVCEGDEHMLMFVRQKRDQLRGLLVVVQDSDEVVIVRARGRLDRLIEDALRMARDEEDLRRGRERNNRAANAGEADEAEADEPEPGVLIASLDPGEPAVSCSDDPRFGVDCDDPELARGQVRYVAELFMP